MSSRLYLEGILFGLAALALCLAAMGCAKPEAPLSYPCETDMECEVLEDRAADAGCHAGLGRDQEQECIDRVAGGAQ